MRHHHTHVFVFSLVSISSFVWLVFFFFLFLFLFDFILLIFVLVLLFARPVRFHVLHLLYHSYCSPSDFLCVVELLRLLVMFLRVSMLLLFFLVPFFFIFFSYLLLLFLLLVDTPYVWACGVPKASFVFFLCFFFFAQLF